MADRGNQARKTAGPGPSRSNPTPAKRRPRSARREAPEASGASQTTINVLGTYLLVVGVLTLTMLVELWPAVEGIKDAGQATTQTQTEQSGSKEAPNDNLKADGTSQVEFRWLGAILITLTPDAALLVMALMFGAAGASVHAAVSFVDYVGNRRLVDSWIWWYAFRPFVGASLALVFYVALRAGFFAPTAGTADINRFGIAALAALAGMFSKQASDKLSEIFNTLFGTAAGTGDDARSDSLTAGAPTLLSVDPSTITAGSTQASLVLQGRDFAPASSVLVDDSAEHVTTSFVSSTQLKVTLAGELLVEPGALEIKVVNPEPSEGTSGALPVEVVAEGSDEG